MHENENEMPEERKAPAESTEQPAAAAALPAAAPVEEAGAPAGPEVPTASAHEPGDAGQAQAQVQVPTPAPPAAADEAPAAPAPEPTLADTAAALAERFPALFAAGQPRPIKLRVQADIQQRAPGVFTKKQLSIFLHRHTTSTAYIRALVASGQRFDLDGQPAGEVAAEHMEAAKAELERRRQIVMERRAQGRPQGRPEGRPPGRPEGRPQGQPRGPAQEPGREAAGAAGSTQDGPPAAGSAARPPRGRGPRARGAMPLADAASTQASAATTARADRGPRSDRPGPRPPRPSQPGQPPRQGRDARPDAPGRPDRPPRPGQGDRRGGPDRPGSPHRSAGPQGPGHAPRSQVPQAPRPRHPAHDTAEAAPGLPEDPARRERAQLLRSFEGSPLTAANFCALKGLSLGDFESQIAQARREREERSKAAGAGR